MNKMNENNSLPGTDRLEVLREQIHDCDEIIIDALLRRFSLVEEVMAVKKARHMQIVQPQQEARQNEWLRSVLAGSPYTEEVTGLFEQIRRTSKSIQAHRLFEENVFLIGFMGVGKTTISGYMHMLLDMDVIEMDDVIAAREGMSIPDIFEVHGESYFRNAETRLLTEMQGRSGTVVSCGGGVPMRDENVREMKKSGRIILLTAEPQTILERVRDSHDRPILENNKTVEFIASLMEKRREKYEAAADLTVRTDHRTELEICNEIISGILAMNPDAER